MEQRARAERIVAANIEKWGWGPIDEIDGLSEHKLAVDACEAGLSLGSELLEALREVLRVVDELYREHEIELQDEDVETVQFARAAIAKAMGDKS